MISKENSKKEKHQPANISAEKTFAIGKMGGCDSFFLDLPRIAQAASRNIEATHMGNQHILSTTYLPITGAVSGTAGLEQNSKITSEHVQSRGTTLTG